MAGVRVVVMCAIVLENHRRSFLLVVGFGWILFWPLDRYLAYWQEKRLLYLQNNN